MGEAYLMRRGTGGSDLNFRVVGAAYKQGTPKNNTIWVETAVAIPEWAIALENPYIAYKDTDVLAGVSTTPGYISSSGEHAAVSDYAEVRTTDDIAVEYGKTYTYEYKVTTQQSLWLVVAEYDKWGSFIKRTSLLSSVSATEKTGTYTPSSATVAKVCFSWRTFNDSGCTVKFIVPDAPCTIDGTPDGTVWIRNHKSPTSFNAIKSVNSLIVKPNICMQYRDGDWHETYAEVYQNGEWFDLKWYLLKWGEDYADLTGGWIAVGKRGGDNSSASAVAPFVQHVDAGWSYGYTIVETITDEGGGMFHTANKIDLTPYKTLVLEGNFTRGGTVARNFTAGVWSAIGTYYTSNLLAYTQPPVAAFNRVEVDISDINVEAYVGIGITVSEAEITKIYFEPKGELA